MAQDDSRENEQISIFGLNRKSKSNRGSEYMPDAFIEVDGITYNFELKTGSKTSFSTARGMCREKTNEWKKKNNFFLFSKYKKTKQGFAFTRHIICTHDNLQWWFDKVIDWVDVSGHAGKIGLDEYKTKVRPLIETILPESFMEQFDKTVRVGTQYNDPKININKLIENGAKELDIQGDLAQQVLDYIRFTLTKSN